MDVVDRKTRSRMMAGIGAKDTSPEMLIRRGLHEKGYRYRLHVRSLPGQPDLYLAKYRTAIFVNGCFWHLHGCHLFKWPKTRVQFWREKISKNRMRDIRNIEKCHRKGIRTLVVWECEIKGQSEDYVALVLLKVKRFLESSAICGEIPPNRDLLNPG